MCDADLCESQTPTSFKQKSDESTLYDDTYAFDLETYADSKNIFVPYACGFVGLKPFARSIKRDVDAARSVEITSGNGCILEMLCSIDR